MSDYTLSTNFGAKDDLTTGDPNKLVRGSEFQTEFEALETAIATKADLANPTLNGPITIDNGGGGAASVSIAATGGYFKIDVDPSFSNNKLMISWDGVDIASIDESGNLIVAGTVTASSTP